MTTQTKAQGAKLGPIQRKQAERAFLEAMASSAPQFVNSNTLDEYAAELAEALVKGLNRIDQSSAPGSAQ
ncbi:hypothetical protein [Salinicola socius]|uniref:Uncharacterized protein n=1 Tax=Salinicola socius TaxID=404433 RepID=A0A1Q8SPG0_9GAMM|nr:hypothetical protein [Salinicola socius]OLO03313.1 hypothetical protein BTW07_14610 [Salinicola socius]